MLISTKLPWVQLYIHGRKMSRFFRPPPRSFVTNWPRLRATRRPRVSEKDPFSSYATMPRANKTSAGCLILFALPFAAVGIGIAIWNMRTVLRYQEMRSWVEVRATIKRAELKVDHDPDGGDTYQAVADYEYDFQGR